MPEFTPFVIVISSLTVLAEVVAVLLMYRNGYAGRWRSLFFLLVYKASIDTTIAAVVLPLRDQNFRAEAYFYSFWIAKIGEGFMQYWVLWQIAEKLLPTSDRVRRIGLVCFALVAASNLAISAYCSIHASIPLYARIGRFALHAEKSESLAWCLTFLLVTFGSGLIGILWRTEMLVVAAGFALHVAVQMMDVWAFSMHIPDLAASILSAGDIGFLLSLALWICYFRSRRKELMIDMELADEIHGDLRALRAMER